MLNKFQEQELFSTVENLENLKEDIDKIISSVKNIKPSLFNGPSVAKYNTPDGRYDPTPIINDDDNTIDGCEICIYGMDGEE